MKLAEIDSGPLEEFAAAAGIRGSAVELHVLAQCWELRAEGVAPLEIEAGDPAALDLAARKQTCARSGHTYEVLVEFGANRPANVICDRCGDTWGVPE